MVCRPTGCNQIGFEEKLEHLRQAAVKCQREEIIKLIGDLIPAYNHQVVQAK
jgi:hypothetical protein